MKRRLIWFAILVPAAFYVLLFLTEGLSAGVRAHGVLGSDLVLLSADQGARI